MIQKGLWRMLGVSLLALVPARIIYTMCFYDPDNGVYRDGGGWGYLLIILFLLAAGLRYYNTSVDCLEVAVTVAGLPEAFDGLRILLLTEKYSGIGHRARAAPHSLPLFGSL